VVVINKVMCTHHMNMHKINFYFVLTFFRHEKIILTSDSIRRLPAVVRVVTMFLLCVIVCLIRGCGFGLCHQSSSECCLCIL